MPQDATPISADLLREAESAGNDAAAEARADVLARGRSKAGKQAPAAKASNGWVRFDVDVWITDLNPVEFGFYKRSRNKAKSRQFTSDMDIYAEIRDENGQRSGLIGYREELWKKSEGFEKRLVFKLFGEKLNWQATMDLMLARSVQETVGARGIPIPCYAVNTNNHDQVVYIERSANKWKFLAEHFSFFLMDEGKLRFYRIKQQLISLGRDYIVYDAAGRKVAVLDGRLFSLGGYWKCRVAKDHADARTLAVLKMFVGMLVFNGGCRRHIKQLAKDVARGRVPLKLQRQESDLYMNPRRVR